MNSSDMRFRTGASLRRARTSGLIPWFEHFRSLARRLFSPTPAKQAADYRISASSYLERARAALQDGRHESLFYAALELRCGIEARMREYLQAHEHVSKKKREGWRVAVLVAGLEEAFGASKREARITICDEAGESLVAYSYRPVTERLEKAAQRLGNLLHAQREPRSQNNPWWSETRSFLEETCRQLEWTVSGDLYGVPLLGPDGHMHMKIAVDADWAPPFERGMKTVVKVKYVDPPEFM